MLVGKKPAILLWFISVGTCLAVSSFSWDDGRRISTFTPSPIPVVIQGDEARRNYFIAHYWDTYDFTGQKQYDRVEVEKAFAAYAALINEMPYDEASVALVGTMHLAATDTSGRLLFMKWCEKYFYEPGSPIRNEELFVSVLDDWLVMSSEEDPIYARYEQLARQCKRNRVGYNATNFSFELQNGKSVALNDFASPFVLVLFYDPECETCQAFIGSLRGSVIVDDLVSKQKLAVITVCVEGDQQQWLKVYPKLKSCWINGIDREQKIRKKSLYDLRALPTAYLLDRSKQVILKDATFERLTSYLEQQRSR